VPRERVTTAVAIFSSGGPGVTRIAFDAMAERKMSPASCTCPIAKGSVERIVNIHWWTTLEKSTSFTSAGKTSWKAGSLKMMAA
jgi:hypothetical protein